MSARPVPRSESMSSCVSFESRYGTKAPPPPVPPPRWPPLLPGRASLAITLPSANRLRLMLPAIGVLDKKPGEASVTVWITVACGQGGVCRSMRFRCALRCL